MESVNEIILHERIEEDPEISLENLRLSREAKRNPKYARFVDGLISFYRTLKSEEPTKAKLMFQKFKEKFGGTLVILGLGMGTMEDFVSTSGNSSQNDLLTGIGAVLAFIGANISTNGYYGKKAVGEAYAQKYPDDLINDDSNRLN
jgi:hypothetical protein